MYQLTTAVVKEYSRGWHKAEDVPPAQGTGISPLLRQKIFNRSGSPCDHLGSKLQHTMVLRSAVSPSVEVRPIKNFTT